MNISLLIPNSPRKIFLRLASCCLIAVAGLSAVARADVTATVDKGQSSSAHKTTDPTLKNGKQVGGATSTDTITGSVFYTITVRNLADTPVKGVTIEYHIFNRTLTTSSNSPAVVTLADITNSSTIDLDPNGRKTIETSDIPKSVSNSNKAPNTSKKGVSTPGTSSSTVTSVMGWVVYIKKSDKTIHTIPSSDTILDEVDRVKKASMANS